VDKQILSLLVIHSRIDSFGYSDGDGALATLFSLLAQLKHSSSTRNLYTQQLLSLHLYV